MTISESDVAALQNLQRLASHVFDGHWEFVDRVFVPDAVLDAGGAAAPFSGVTQIQAAVTKSHSTRRTTHFATNPIVLDATGEGRVQMITKFLVGIEDPDGQKINFGTYHDTCIATDSGWRIGHRRLERAFLFGS
jgi:SnoaL-like domain